MSKIFVLISILIISVLALSGCATTRNIEGRPIMSATVNKITNGVTTKGQVLQMFGPPLSIKKNMLHPGEVTYRYKFRYKKYVHLGNEILTSATRKLTEKLDVVIKNSIVIAHSFTMQGNTSLKKILKKHKKN
jgi:outer membrane protein assembly factor BamE (lipoprotein component of BamABCDE complex)